MAGLRFRVGRFAVRDPGGRGRPDGALPRLCARQLERRKRLAADLGPDDHPGQHGLYLARNAERHRALRRRAFQRVRPQDDRRRHDDDDGQLHRQQRPALVRHRSRRLARQSRQVRTAARRQRQCSRAGHCRSGGRRHAVRHVPRRHATARFGARAGDARRRAHLQPAARRRNALGRADRRARAHRCRRHLAFSVACAGPQRVHHASRRSGRGRRPLARHDGGPVSLARRAHRRQRTRPGARQPRDRKPAARPRRQPVVRHGASGLPPAPDRPARTHRRRRLRARFLDPFDVRGSRGRSVVRQPDRGPVSALGWLGQAFVAARRIVRSVRVERSPRSARAHRRRHELQCRDQRSRRRH